MVLAVTLIIVRLALSATRMVKVKERCSG